MKLSNSEISHIDAIYYRVRLHQKYGKGGFAVFGIVIAVNGFQMFRQFNEMPLLAAAVSALFGLVLGFSIAATFIYQRQIKKDEETVKLFERLFPDQCSWIIEEKKLALAEEIRIKAIVSEHITQDTQQGH